MLQHLNFRYPNCTRIANTNDGVSSAHAFGPCSVGVRERGPVGVG